MATWIELQLALQTDSRSHGHMDMPSGRTSEAVMVALTTNTLINTSLLHEHDQTTRCGAWEEHLQINPVNLNMLSWEVCNQLLRWFVMNSL